MIVTDEDVRVAVHAHMTALFGSTAKADRRIKEPVLWTYFSGLDRRILEAVEADRERRTVATTSRGNEPDAPR